MRTPTSDEGTTPSLPLCACAADGSRAPLITMVPTASPASSGAARCECRTQRVGICRYPPQAPTARRPACRRACRCCVGSGPAPAVCCAASTVRSDAAGSAGPATGRRQVPASLAWRSSRSCNAREAARQAIQLYTAGGGSGMRSMFRSRAPPTKPAARDEWTYCDHIPVRHVQ